MSEDKNLKQAIQEHDKRINNITALKGADWQDQLRLTTQGAIRRSSLYNILLFIENDPNLKGVLAYNEFS
ncbi:virulence protein, partial [Streptococcus thermophilus]|nr:virulence protein [Streptococcus thermophilus]